MAGWGYRTGFMAQMLSSSKIKDNFSIDDKDKFQWLRDPY